MKDNEKDLLDEIIDEKVEAFIINKLKKVKDCRKRKKLTQKQLAINAALSREKIQQFEYGTTLPTFKSYIKTALALMEQDILISLDDLIELQKEIDEAYEMALKNQAKWFYL